MGFYAIFQITMSAAGIILIIYGTYKLKKMGEVPDIKIKERKDLKDEYDEKTIDEAASYRAILQRKQSLDKQEKNPEKIEESHSENN